MSILIRPSPNIPPGPRPSTNFRSGAICCQGASWEFCLVLEINVPGEYGLLLEQPGGREDSKSLDKVAQPPRGFNQVS